MRVRDEMKKKLSIEDQIRNIFFVGHDAASRLILVSSGSRLLALNSISSTR